MVLRETVKLCLKETMDKEIAATAAAASAAFLRLDSIDASTVTGSDVGSVNVSNDVAAVTFNRDDAAVYVVPDVTYVDDVLEVVAVPYVIAVPSVPTLAQPPKPKRFRFN